MRPRKRILLRGGNDRTHSRLRLVLDNRGYRVETKIMDMPPDVFLLIGFSEAEQEAFEQERWKRCPHSKAVCVTEAEIDPANGGMAELLHRLRLATVRKRGPMVKQVEYLWRTT